MAAASAGNNGLQLLLNLGIDPATTAQLLDLFKEALEISLRKTLAEISTSASPSHVSQAIEPPAFTSKSPGTELKPQDKIKAADLRIALLMGKVPEDTGLLIPG